MTIKNQVTVVFNSPEDLMFLKSILWLAEVGLDKMFQSQPHDIVKNSGFGIEFSQRATLKRTDEALLILCNQPRRVNV